MEPNKELINELVDVKILVSTKQKFTQPEQIKIYNLYNKITGDTKQPNGCPACLNNTISRIKKECRAYGI